MGFLTGKSEGLDMAGLKFTIRDNFTAEFAKKLADVSTKGEHALAVQVAKDTEPFVPAMTKSLVNRTQVFGNQIVYPGPYSRYLYYGRVMVDSKTGRGPMKIVGKDGSVIIRFRKGAKLVPTERPLKISKAVHPQAQSHWLEASKAANLEKWERVAGRIIKNGI